MTDDLVKRLRGWAKRVLQGSTVVWAMDQDLKEAADRIEALTAEVQRWQGLFDEKHNLMLEQKARAEKAEAERDEATNQLDSAIHSVEVLEKRVAGFMADNARLRKSCECAMSEIRDYMQEVGVTLPLELAMGWLSAALNTGKEVMPDDAQYNQPADIGPGDQAVAGAALPTVDELAQIIRTVDGNAIRALAKRGERT